jgi:hypothetical protein
MHTQPPDLKFKSHGWSDGIAATFLPPSMDEPQLTLKQRDDFVFGKIDLR